MERAIMKIICYTGGACGDVVTALFDSNGTLFKDNTVIIDADRSRLKKPHEFANDQDKDQYIMDVATKYQSMPSHDLNYHVSRQHEFIGITVQDWAVAMWAAQRFKDLHRPHVWAEMSAACGACTVEEYAQMMIDFSNLITQHTDQIVTLESIRSGVALENPVLKNTDRDFYLKWLALQI